MSNIFESIAPDALSVGKYGSVYIKGTTANTGHWGCIYALTDVTFTALTSGNKQGGTAVMQPGVGQSNLNGMVLPAGAAIWGYFTGLTLGAADDEVICYNVV